MEFCTLFPGSLAVCATEMQNSRSFIVHRENPSACSILFFSSAAEENSITAVFVHTLLWQIVHSLQVDKILIVRRFLHSLLKGIFERGATMDRELKDFKTEDPPEANIRKILKAGNEELWAALRTVLADEQNQELSIVIDGLECVQQQRDIFIKGVRSFVQHLQQRASNVRILLTSQPQDDIKEIFNGFSCIEYDKERQGLFAT